jgi:hypothetical protein
VFREILLLTDGPFEKSINWIDNYEWTLEGYDTHVKLGPMNMALIGWITTHKPIILLTHAPGKNIAVHQATADANKISSLIDDIKIKAMHELILFKKTSSTKIQEIQGEKDDWERKYYQLYQDVKSNDDRNVIDKHENYGAGIYRNKKETRKKIWTWVGVIAVIGIIALVLFMTTGGAPPLNNSTAIIP